MDKKASLVLVLVVVLLSLSAAGAFAETEYIPKPAIPEFTVKYADNSYDIPATYDTNQYTGQTEVLQAGYHVQNKTVEVAIRNQPFTPYTDSNGNTVRLWYSVRMKGHFVDAWSYPDYGSWSGDNYVPANPDSEYTVIVYGIIGDDNGYLSLDIPDGGQADFQVQAFTGYSTVVSDPPSPADVFSHGVPSQHQVFAGVTSDWSATQMVTVGVPTLIATFIPFLVVAVLLSAVGVMFYIKKRRHQITLKQSDSGRDQR